MRQDDGAVDAKLNDELVRLSAAAVWVDTLTLRRYFGHDFREFPPLLSSKIRETNETRKKKDFSLLVETSV